MGKLVRAMDIWSCYADENAKVNDNVGQYQTDDARAYGHAYMQSNIQRERGRAKGNNHGNAFADAYAT